MNKIKVSMDALKSFVRKEGSQFLKQQNITSIGIGYKIKGKKPTKEICIQFTVGRKVAPEGLEGIGATELPKFITIEGVDVPTDVIQRSFDTDAKGVSLKAKLEAAAIRKAVANPVMPGVSIGHPSISAGTAGCIVFDAQTGAPYILSNWHVLNGPKGSIGDPIVQPGKYDDNRVDRNVIGRLIRSHLGIAGDCAIASVEQRQLESKIIDLNIAVERIGEPELGDRIVKSGRTTDVTYGIVTRVHVTTRIDYDEAGIQEIGCFEIGPDAKNPAQNGEISMGGDSGSVWLYVDKGKPTDMMLGLHFAGEVGDESEYALACYPSSIFEKLGILPMKPTRVNIVSEAELGYSTTFIGAPISLPVPENLEVREDLLEVSGRSVIDYMHFSIAMSRSRRFARWVAWNIDGGSVRKLSRNGLNFKKDPNIPANAQIGNELYTNNPLDRGHIARRADLIWGSPAEAQQANKDSFFYTNITPQHEAFNQSEANGVWGEIENAIFADVDVNDLRISVMSGPIFSVDDPVYREIRLPRQFWKIIFFRESGDEEIKAKGFVLTQADLLNQLEVLDLPEFSVYEVPISQIGEMTGLTLPSCVKPENLEQQRESIAARNSKIRRIPTVREIIN